MQNRLNPVKSSVKMSQLNIQKYINGKHNISLFLVTDARVMPTAG